MYTHTLCIAQDQLMYRQNFKSTFVLLYKPEMHEFFLTLSLCHTVHATEEEDDNAPYPYHYQVYASLEMPTQ